MRRGHGAATLDPPQMIGALVIAGSGRTGRLTQARDERRRRRHLHLDPRAVADGTLGFWQAIEEVGPKTRGQASVACRLQMLGASIPNSAPSTSWKSPVDAPRR
jgi:hypothetical protein